MIQTILLLHSEDSIGKINEMENVLFKFQILFVFGYGYQPTDEEIKKWKEESTNHLDLIMPGK